ncbi:MAG TPA: polyprenyl diphosphate synthase [Gammaproteobacteria bacterium]|nr:polyprenyl diphosphate synthase [Gammaproteobacteria bacterium]
MTDSSVTRLPVHIAIIMDGNGRWAKRRHLPRGAGHKAGLTAARRTIERCGELRIKALTLFAFSSENWRRPDAEVGGLMELFMTALQTEVEKLHRNQVKVRFIGDLGVFSPALREAMLHTHQLTDTNAGMQLNIAVGYGGRWDIVQAARLLAEQVANGKREVSEIDEQLLGSALALGGCPDPDLFIRTGGEHRISNFLLWNLAYTELYFTELLWPDFDAEALDSAIEWFAGRERRFGLTSEQVRGAGHA